VLFARSRAVENRRPHVYLNRVGRESGLTFVGGSCVVSAAGEVLADLADAEETRIVDVGFGPPPAPDYVAERRPDVPVVLPRPSAC
jgi:(R)-amidase